MKTYDTDRQQLVYTDVDIAAEAVCPTCQGRKADSDDPSIGTRYSNGDFDTRQTVTFSCGWRGSVNYYAQGREVRIETWHPKN